MLLSTTITNMLNEQIAHEMKNEHIYRDVQAYFEDKNMNGFAKFFATQAEGEYDHRKKIIEYLADKNAKIGINVDQYIPQNFLNIPAILDLYYNTEIGTTQLIYDIVKQARAENDEGTVQWLYSFLVPEQVEEEKTALDLKAEVMDGFGEDTQLFMVHVRAVDRRLSED